MQSFVVLAPLLLVIAIAIAAVVPTIVGRLLPDRHRESFLKSTLATGGTIVSPFMIVLGFMVVVLWGQINDADKAIERESVALRDVAALTSNLDPTTAAEIRGRIVTYSAAAAAEWPSLADGKPSAAASDAFRALRDEILALPGRISGTGDTILVTHAIDQVLVAQGHRADRLSAAASEIHGVLWIALIVGTILYIAYLALTDTGSRRSRSVILFIAISVVGLILMLIAMLDNPFTGDVRADPAPFTRLVDEIQAGEQ